MNATSLVRLVEHPLGTAVGWMLLHFLWQASLVSLVAAGWLAAMRRSASARRYAVASGGLLIMAALPLVTLALLMRDADADAAGRRNESIADVGDPSGTTATPTPRFTQPASAMNAFDRESADAPPAFVPRTSLERPPAGSYGAELGISEVIQRQLRSVMPWCVAVWGAGVCLLALRLILGWLRIRWWRHEALELQAHRLQNTVKDLARRMGMRLNIQLLQTARTEVPAVIGWLRPAILLPASAISGLTAQELEAVLAHELAHIRRHDYLVNLLQTMMETVLFYHPAVWWLSHRVRVEREYCCDDLAVSVCGNKGVFVNALVRIEQWRCEKPPLALAASDGSLVSRIRRLLAPNTCRSISAWPAGLAVLASMALLLSSLWISAVVAQSAHSAGLVSRESPAAEQSPDPFGSPGSGEAWRPPARTADPVAKPQDLPQDQPASQPDGQAGQVGQDRLPWAATGRVTDAAGNPLEGATVNAHCGAGTLRRTGVATTDADGKYTLRFGPGVFFSNRAGVQAATISVHLAGYFEKNLHRQGDLVAAMELPPGDIGWGHKTADDLFLPGKPKQLDFVMLPAANLRGVIVDAAGQQLSNVRVSLTGEDLPPSSSVIAQARTNDLGAFEFRDIPTGFKYHIMIEPEKAQPPWLAWVSAPMVFVHGDSDQVHLEYLVDGKPFEFSCQALRLVLHGAGTNWKKALSAAAEQALEIHWEGTKSDVAIRATTASIDIGNET